MGLMGFLRKLFYRNKGLSALGSATIALAIGLQGLFDKEKKEVERDIVQQELVIKETKKYIAEGKISPKVREKEETAQEKLKKLNIMLKKVNSEEEQVKLAIKMFEAEPLYDYGDDNSIYNLRIETERNKTKLAIIKGLTKLSDEDYNLLKSYTSTLSEKTFPTNILTKFPGTVNLNDIIAFIDFNNQNILYFVFKEEFNDYILLQIKRNQSKIVINMKKEKERLEKYFEINSKLVKLLESKGSQRRLRSYTDKMNQLNDDLAEYLLELDRYITSLQKLSNFAIKHS